MGSPSDRARSDQDLETAVSYLTAVRNGFGSLLKAPWGARIPTAKLARVDDVLGAALYNIDVPQEWIRRHAGISPFAMSRMMEALARIELLGPFIPVDPELEDASKQYGRIFDMMGHYMTTVFGQGGRCHALGILTTNWMLGHPVKRIITSRARWNRKKGISESISRTIRKTLEDIEQIARFQAPRYLACYSDIVRTVIERRGDAHEALVIPDLTLSLEFGVRGPVQLGLMALGLSRSSTLAIADAVTAQLTRHEFHRVAEDPSVLADALRRLEPQALQLPTLILNEVVQLRATLGLSDQ